MNLTKFGISFFFFFLVIIIVMDLKISFLQKMVFTKIRYNQILDNAVWDVLYGSIEKDNYQRDIYVNREELKKDFLKHLYEDFGIYDNTAAKRKMEENIICFLVTETDGFSICRWQTSETEENKRTKRLEFGEKQIFETAYGGYHLQLFFGDYLRVTGENLELPIEGNYLYVMNQIGKSLFTDRESYETWKRGIITGQIREAMENVIHKNEFVSREGLKYVISFPRIQYEEWYQTIDGIGILMFFESPRISFLNQPYYRFVFSGSRMIKKEE